MRSVQLCSVHLYHHPVGIVLERSLEPRHRFYTHEIAPIFLFDHKNVESTELVFLVGIAMF